MKVTCNHCKLKVEVSMYFYGTEISTRHSDWHGKTLYIAHTKGKTICPLCGKEFEKDFYNEITDGVIVGLATKELNNDL